VPPPGLLERKGGTELAAAKPLPLAG
jgi:hypothetical protein